MNIFIMHIEQKNLKKLSLEPDRYEVIESIKNKDGSISCEMLIHDQKIIDMINNRTPIGCSVRYDYDDEIFIK